ncbi:mucin-2-like [Patella vulgata]|uniref:mucin-2-like n=1 Tax=Patella vulgata TaxID=6465 RepID=UPI00218086D1|nr:mucin-2-like [Patella vulgata]
MNSSVSNNLRMYNVTWLAFTKDYTDGLSETEGYCLNVITSNADVKVTKTCYNMISPSTSAAPTTPTTKQQPATSVPVTPSPITTISEILTPFITTISPSFSATSEPVNPSTTTTISAAQTPSVTTLSPSFSSSSPHQKSTTVISKPLSKSITNHPSIASSAPPPPSSSSSSSSHARQSTTIKSSSVQQEYTRTQLVPRATTPTYDPSKPSGNLAILVYGIIGGVTGLCLLIIVIIMIVCICKQRHKNDHYKPSEKNEENHNSKSVPPKGEMNIPENDLDVSQGENQSFSVTRESHENNPGFLSTQYPNDVVIMEHESDVPSPTSNLQGAPGNNNHDRHDINGIASDQ